MCGRCCLTLEPIDIKKCCQYQNSNKKDILPEWRSEYNLGRKYEPSYNVAPGDITPVLVSSDHFEDLKEQNPENNRFLVPMLWGMIPPWHKGDYKKHGLTTNNCRLEHMLQSKLYSPPLKKGQRCVIVCEGFYEWQTTRSVKSSERAAFYIHMPQKVKDIKMYDKSTWDQENLNLNLLKLAGLFDTWKDANGDMIYSYTIITFESNKLLSWLHHRTPAILETEEQVSDWLDFKRVPYKDAIKVIKNPENLSWYRVSNIVNNSRNKQSECNKPIEDKPKSKGASCNILKNWLSVGKRKEHETHDKKESDIDKKFNEVDSKDKIEPIKKRRMD